VQVKQKASIRVLLDMQINGWQKVWQDETQKISGKI
jgi:hypothetical protein